MNATEIYSHINLNCKKFLEDLQKTKKGNFLLRGTHDYIDNISEYKTNLLFRKPRDNKQEDHDKLNERFLQEFGWNVRNGVFCYGFNSQLLDPINLGYGPFKIFFPQDEYQIVYSPTIFDLYGHLNIENGNIEDIFSQKLYTTATLVEYFKSEKNFDFLHNEAMIKTSKYYLVNYKYKSELSKLIWP